MSELIITRCNPTKVLQLIEEVLNQMALTINVVITGPRTIGLKSIFETGFKRHSEPRLPSTAQINH